jgi:hypothetical protein
MARIAACAPRRSQHLAAPPRARKPEASEVAALPTPAG